MRERLGSNCIIMIQAVLPGLVSEGEGEGVSVLTLLISHLFSLKFYCMYDFRLI